MLLSPVTPTLRELQRGFERCLFEPQRATRRQLPAELSNTGVPTRIKPETAIAAYRNNVLTTLSRALGLSFPAVRRLVGADFFAAMAQEFIRVRPAASAYLNDYGGGFARFLRYYPPVEGLSYLPEVAELEWAVNRALHAPDPPRLDPRQLARLGAADRAMVALVPHPSVSIMRCHHPVDQIWRAVLEQDGEAMRRIDLSDGARWLLVERDSEDLVQLRRMRSAVGQFLQRLCQRAPIEPTLAESMASFVDEQWHEILAEQLTAGRFVDFQVPKELEVDQEKSQDDSLRRLQR